MTTVSDRAASALYHRSPQVREDAIRKLGYRGSDDRFAVPDLIRALKDPFAAVRKHSARALGRIGPDAEEAVSALTTLVMSEHLKDVWRSAFFAICQIGRDSEEAVLVFCGLLSDTIPERRYRAAEMLGVIGPAARGVVSTLIDKLTFDPVWEVRRTVAHALGQIGPPGDVVPALSWAMTHDVNFVVRRQAAKTIGWLGSEANAAVPALIAALDDVEISVQCQAAVSLGLMGDSAGAAVPELTRRLQTGCPPADRDLMWALRQISRSQLKASQDVAWTV